MEKILLVEDEKMIADIVVRFFEKKGFKVDVAYDLPHGMEKYDPGYDIVILDIALKSETSFPLLERIKKEKPETTVLMFSGYDSEEYITKAKHLGADGFIPKPFRMEFLDDFLAPKIEAIRRKKAEAKKKE